MKRLTVFLLLIPMALMLMNCAGEKPAAKKLDVPDWYLNPPQAEDAIYQAGDAVKVSMALAKEAADARARDAIARTIELKVSTMLKDFMQQSGAGQDAEAIEFTSVVSKQVANNVLRGCKIVKREMKVEGNQYHAYSLAEYNLNSLINETLNEARKQKALYNEAKANLGFEELEKEIQKLEAVGK
jgi:hypothetical protein